MVRWHDSTPHQNAAGRIGHRLKATTEKSHQMAADAQPAIHISLTALARKERRKSPSFSPCARLPPTPTPPSCKPSFPPPANPKSLYTACFVLEFCGPIFVDCQFYPSPSLGRNRKDTDANRTRPLNRCFFCCSLEIAPCFRSDAKVERKHERVLEKAKRTRCVISS